MARPRQVTRTIKTTTVRVKVADLSTNTIVEKEYDLVGEYEKTNKKLLPILSKENPEEKIVSIVSTEIVSTLYSVPEDKFIKLALECAIDRIKQEQEEETMINGEL